MRIRSMTSVATGCTLALLFAWSTAAPADAGCPINLWMADFRAIGSTHRFAEYVITLGLPSARFNRTYSVTFSAGADRGKEQTSFTMDGLRFDPEPSGDAGDAAILVILPAAGIRWVGISRVSDDGGTVTDCSATAPFELSNGLLGAFESFDDGSIDATSKPIVARLEGLQFIKLVPPDYPDQALDQNMQGEAQVIFTVHGDGSMSDYAVLRSTGFDLLDQEAVRTAKLVRISPARLPASLGGTPIDTKFVIVFTWALDQ